MRLAACAEPDLLRRLMAPFETGHIYRWLRAPEIGLVMARGRAGGDGAPFNLGEVSATRCALTLDDGTVGHAVVLGRDKAHAARAALLDALMQTKRAGAVRDSVLAPLAEAEAAARTRRARKAAATRVEFFTMTREG
jgi:alpha-D-ribose 1-methylphosphonate 5-triphosphate synthase subunit PhnG